MHESRILHLSVTSHQIHFSWSLWFFHCSLSSAGLMCLSLPKRREEERKVFQNFIFHESKVLQHFFCSMDCGLDCLSFVLCIEQKHLSNENSSSNSNLLHILAKSENLLLSCLCIYYEATAFSLFFLALRFFLSIHSLYSSVQMLSYCNASEHQRYTVISVICYQSF